MRLPITNDNLSVTNSKTPYQMTIFDKKETTKLCADFKVPYPEHLENMRFNDRHDFTQTRQNYIVRELGKL